ncbi:phosphoserine phosphatase [Vibrio metschnikovii]|uniref:phosphoserine phosphatase n=1 Tax=Vibrio metschnikovii TaxID=28172 RepID=UPI001C2F8A42|nr:phosphoserine phosphatase [Vibrio metschnikovii]
MDAVKPLSIRKHTMLLNRYPETRESSALDKAHANWIIFAQPLTPAHFMDIEQWSGQGLVIVDTWKVGNYDVALMTGELDTALEPILQHLHLDYARIDEVPDLSKPGLIVLDMDSTAIQIECIDEIAKLAGVGDEVAQVTERAMQGELDFEQSLRQRVAKLKGADAAILEKVRNDLPLMPELPELLTTLQAMGWKTAIASGGFTYFSDHLQQLLSLDYAQSNQLEIINNQLSGEVKGEIVGAQTKAEIVLKLAQQFDIELHNTVAVGDGANDLVMMEVAGLGIAYHAKPKVEAKAQTAVRFASLGGVLCILSAGLIRQQKISWKSQP